MFVEEYEGQTYENNVLFVGFSSLTHFSKNATHSDDSQRWIVVSIHKWPLGAA